MRTLLKQVPIVKLVQEEHEVALPDGGVDFIVRVEVSGRNHTLICEVKANGQPRYVRMGVLQLRNYVAHRLGDATPVFIAPYLSPEARALCREKQVSYLDLEGNAYLTFNGVFIERVVATKPQTEKRQLRSLFKPKAAQILRVMLREPRLPWRLADLAEEANVSLGQVSNVRAGLLEREWAAVSGEGTYLSNPDALLDAWREAYVIPKTRRIGYYTTLHGSAFEDAARKVLRAGSQSGRIIFSSFSAAQWLEPYARTGTHYFYADDFGNERLQDFLKLSPSAKGENVIVMIIDDSGVFQDSIEPAPGIVCTSAVQTYLDLWRAGERGREAAEHLRGKRLAWA